MQCNVELTDTFGREANYSWVKRAIVPTDDNPNNLTIMRRAKALVGMAGIRGVVSNYGDCVEIRFPSWNRVMFITWEH